MKTSNYIIVSVLLCILINASFTILRQQTGLELNAPTRNLTSIPSIIFEIVSATIIVAFLETLVFQSLIINLLTSMKVKPWITIIVSSIIFGLTHWYSVSYILYATSIGLILASTYYLFKYIRHQSGFWITVAIHAIYNGLLVTVQIVLYII